VTASSPRHVVTGSVAHVHLRGTPYGRGDVPCEGGATGREDDKIVDSPIAASRGMSALPSNFDLDEDGIENESVASSGAQCRERLRVGLRMRCSW